MRPWWLALVLVACRFDPAGIDLTSPTGDGAVADAPGNDGAPADALRPDATPPAPDATPIDAMPSCPANYQARAGSTSSYRFIQTQKTWAEAEADCADDGAPYTSLVVIGDLLENGFVDTTTSNRDVWIGADDQVAEGRFVDPFGATIAFDLWGFGEPSNGGDPANDPGEDCAELLDGSGTWNDLPCASTMRYLCECDPTR